METSNKIIATVSVLVVVVVAVAAYKVLSKKNPEDVLVVSSTSVSSTGTASTAPSTTPSMSAAAGTYHDGTYSAAGEYRSPAGPEHLNVTLTLKDDIITSATVISPATNPTTKKMQAMFIGGYKPFVIGKNINDVVLTKVSGSSLSPKGFNDAVEKIKAQANS